MNRFDITLSSLFFLWRSQHLNLPPLSPAIGFFLFPQVESSQVGGLTSFFKENSSTGPNQKKRREPSFRLKKEKNGTTPEKNVCVCVCVEGKGSSLCLITHHTPLFLLGGVWGEGRVGFENPWDSPPSPFSEEIKYRIDVEMLG